MALGDIYRYIAYKVSSISIASVFIQRGILEGIALPILSLRFISRGNLSLSKIPFLM